MGIEIPLTTPNAHMGADSWRCLIGFPSPSLPRETHTHTPREGERENMMWVFISCLAGMFLNEMSQGIGQPEFTYYLLHMQMEQ
jgi:hypothetical protein